MNIIISTNGIIYVRPILINFIIGFDCSICDFHVSLTFFRKTTSSSSEKSNAILLEFNDLLNWDAKKMIASKRNRPSVK